MKLSTRALKRWVSCAFFPLFVLYHKLLIGNDWNLQAKAVQNGDSKLYKWFIGQVMGRTKGMADPNTLNQALSESLGFASYQDMMVKLEANDKSSADGVKSSKKGPKGAGDGKKKKGDL